MGTYRLIRRIFLLVAGSLLLLLGVVMLVAPGPAIIFIPAGLAVLGMEFAWARSWLKRLRRGLSSANSRHRAERSTRQRARHTD